MRRAVGLKRAQIGQINLYVFVFEVDVFRFDAYLVSARRKLVKGEMAVFYFVSRFLIVYVNFAICKWFVLFK